MRELGRARKWVGRGAAGILCIVGTCFGSTHLRTRDREAVVTAATRGCRKLRWRCFVSEVRDGWIAVFPGNHGKDLRLTEYLASKLSCDIVHVQVTDEPAFRCWLWRDHARVDENAFAWAPLLRGESPAPLMALLQSNEDEVERVSTFAQLLGLSDVELDYEAIAASAGEHAELTQIPTPRPHVPRPTDAVAVLRDEGPVVAVDVGFVRRTAQRFRGLSLVDPAGDRREPLLEIDGPHRGLVGARYGSRIAFDHHNEVVVLDVDRRAIVARLPATTSWPRYALDADGDRVAVLDGRTLVIHDACGGAAREPLDVEARRIAWHPEGRWIVGVTSALVLIDVERRTTHALGLVTRTLDARAAFHDLLEAAKTNRRGADELELRRDLARASEMFAAIPFEQIVDAECSRDGTTLWLATTLGIHAYDWARLVAAVETDADTLPEARWCSVMQLARIGPEIDDARVIVGCGDTVVTLERHSGRARLAHDVGAHVVDLAVSRDGHWVAVQTGNGHAYGSELARALQVWRANAWRGGGHAK